MRQLGQKHNLFSWTLHYCCVCASHFHTSVFIFMTQSAVIHLLFWKIMAWNLEQARVVLFLFNSVLSFEDLGSEWCCLLCEQKGWFLPFYFFFSLWGCSELSIPSPHHAPQSLPHTHTYIYIYIDIDMYILCSSCPSTHLSVKGCFANNWRSADLLKNQRFIGLNVHCYPILHNNWQGFCGVFFRTHKYFNIK